ncbi:MAG: hypothetical protein K2Y02_06505, partial [Burkholderiaceae bacterium]|nr:hypothetical protein [Burkholderiaceae bacterium]
MMRHLGHRQVEILTEAASEVSRACPWIPICSDRRLVESLVRRRLLGASGDLFGIMPEGCLRLRRYDRDLARRAIRGLRRNRDQGE